MPKTKARAVLLHPSIKALLPFASKDVTRPQLTGIRITPEYAEATDSYRYARLTHVKNDVNPADYPNNVNGDGPAISEIPAEGVLVPAPVIKKAIKAVPRKSILPILNRIALKLSDNYVHLTTTDLDTSEVHVARRIEGKFMARDDIKDLNPETEPTARIALNAEFVEQIAKAMAELTRGTNEPMVIEIWDPMKPAKFSIERRDTGQGFEVWQMPVRMG